jgi:hypothetical protein
MPIVPKVMALLLSNISANLPMAEGADHPIKYGGLELSEAKRLRGLESENAKLKKLLADAMLDNAALKDLLAKKW